MTFSDIIKRSVLEAFSYSEFSTKRLIITLGIVFLFSAYIFLVYRLICRRTFYNRDFNISMAVISQVTAGIIMAMQSNLVIYLGMVGALSIVRFRTAIKEPLDLMFLFWSISIGIICGAGLYEVALFLSLAVTFSLLVFQALPVRKSPYLLIVKADKSYNEAELVETVKTYSPKLRIDSKSVSAHGANIIFEIRTDSVSQLIDQVSALSGISSVSFLHHDGETKA